MILPQIYIYHRIKLCKFANKVIVMDGASLIRPTRLNKLVWYLI